MFTMNNQNNYFQLLDDKKELVSILYSIQSNGVLYIEDMERTQTGRKMCYQDYHLGTIAFNELIVDLLQQGKKVTQITGMLAFGDARKSWQDSIPFYFHFSHYFSYSDLSLIFHLYYDKEHIEEIVLHEEELERIIDNLILYSVKCGRDLFFCYELKRDK